MKARSQAFIPEIESLRGLAATLVLLLHLQGWVNLSASPHGWAWPLGAFVLSGHTGVSLFFVISGYLLAPPFLARTPVSLAAYARRRALRILPAYAAVVVLASLVSSPASGLIGRAVPYLLFLQASPGLVVPMDPFSTVWWSLATEVQFYVLLPLAALVMARLGTTGRFVLITFAIAVYVSFARHWFASTDALTYIALAHSALGRGPLFVIGVAAAAINVRWGATLRRHAQAAPWLRSGGGDIILLADLFGLACLLRWVALTDYWTAEVQWQSWHVVEAGLWVSLLLILLWLPARLKVVLVNRGWAAIGLVSYSLYLWHNPAIVYWMRSEAVANSISPWLRGSAAVVLCLAVASLSYHLLERPFLKHRARF